MIRLRYGPPELTIDYLEQLPNEVLSKVRNQLRRIRNHPPVYLDSNSNVASIKHLFKKTPPDEKLMMIEEAVVEYYEKQQ
jgi:hypothetical protein